MKTLVTERLLLERFAIGDDRLSREAHELFSDENAMRLVGMYPPFTDILDTEKRIIRWAQHERHYAVKLREDGSFIGYVVMNPDGEDIDLGYALIQKYRGRGYMTEAVNAVIAELKTRADVKHIWACCFKGNAQSEAVIRRTGFEFIQEGAFDAPNDRRYESLEFRMSVRQ